eukprot:Skav218648  [mRNA]  locus=scaffold365:625149:626877:+ [translate_table: standard]
MSHCKDSFRAPLSVLGCNRLPDPQAKFFAYHRTKSGKPIESEEPSLTSDQYRRSNASETSVASLASSKHLTS